MLAPYALKYGKKGYHITASFAFGQDILKSSRELLKAAGGTEVGVDEVPLNTADYSSFILKIRQAKPDVVVGGLSAGDLTTFLKQWNELGMKGKIPFVDIADRRHRHLGRRPRSRQRHLHQTVGLHTIRRTRRRKRRSPTAYLKKYGRPAADKAWMGWITARSLFEFDRGGEVDRRQQDHRGAGKLEGAGRRRVLTSYRKWDHQMLLRNLGGVGEGEDHRQVGLLRRQGTLPENPADLDKVFGTQEEIGCKMQLAGG